MGLCVLCQEGEGKLVPHDEGCARHRLCTSCWFRVGEDQSFHQFCGLRDTRCVVQQQAGSSSSSSSGGLTGKKPGSRDLSHVPVRAASSRPGQDAESDTSWGRKVHSSPQQAGDEPNPKRLSDASMADTPHKPIDQQQNGAVGKSGKVIKNMQLKNKPLNPRSTQPSKPKSTECNEDTRKRAQPDGNSLDDEHLFSLSLPLV